MHHSTASDPGTTPVVTSFQVLDLAAPLMKGLAAEGFEQPTEVQAKAIPPALAGRDVMASAQTGTGKTAAFALPALQRLLTPAPKDAAPSGGPRVLVLTPTRELAGQVESMIRRLSKGLRVRMGMIVGGLSYGPQERLLRGDVDILVATPGRLIDHMERGLVDYSRLELFVLDEADRMLDMGFIKPVKRIASALPTSRQTLLFSATLESGVRDIAARLLKDPVNIKLSSTKVAHAAIVQQLHASACRETKHAQLEHLLGNRELTQAIVFTATKHGADRLAKRLKGLGHRTAALHGNMRQNARQKTVDSLRQGKVQVLVATDVAARGIDILGVSHVINFDLPTVAEDYIHRIGRTGRNGATGVAVSLVGPEDRTKLRNIERTTGQRFKLEALAGFEAPVRNIALDSRLQETRPHRQMVPGEKKAWEGTHRGSEREQPLERGKLGGSRKDRGAHTGPEDASSQGHSKGPASKPAQGRPRSGPAFQTENRGRRGPVRNHRSTQPR